MKRSLIWLAIGLAVIGLVPLPGVGQMEVPEATLTSLSATSTGSGAIVAVDGYILTNNHVIEGATSIEVVLASGQSYEAALVEADADRDLALIKIDGSHLPAIPVALDRQMRQGDSVVSIGSPKGLVGTMSTGIITALNREALGLQDLYQTDANIAPGSSGGPLIDECGNLIGINVAVAVEGDVPLTAFGFAIPIGQAEDLLRHVGELPSSRLAVLSNPQIASLCSPATAHIIATSTIPLTQLLPSFPLQGSYSGYADSTGGSWIVLQDGTILTDADISPEFTEYSWDHMAAVHPNASISMRLGDPATRLGAPGLSWTAVGSFRRTEQVSGGEAYTASVLVVECESDDTARLMAERVRDWDMEGLDPIQAGTYTVGSSTGDFRIGAIARPSVLRGATTLQVGNLLFVGTLSWRLYFNPADDHFIGLSSDPRSAIGGSTNPIVNDVEHHYRYYIESGCIYKEHTRTDRLNLGTFVTVQELMCIGDFQKELDELFDLMLSAIAAGLQ